MSGFKQRLTDNANNFDGIVADMLEQITTLQSQVNRCREALEKIEVYNWGWNEDLIDDICNMKDIALEALKEKP